MYDISTRELLCSLRMYVKMQEEGRAGCLKELLEWLIWELWVVQRMALDEQEDVREHLEEVAEASGQYLDDRKQQVR